jgi:hypothetical protein
MRYVIPLAALLIGMALPIYGHAEDGCGCGGAIPVPGVYEWAVDYAVAGGSGIDHVEITVTGRDSGTCGETITMSGDDISVDFVCDNGVYAGSMRGTPAYLAAAEGTGTRAESFVGAIGVPEFHSTKGDFTLLLEEASDRPADCMCQEVREWIDHSEDMISRYTDATILEAALSERQAGIVPGDVAWPNGVEDDEVYKTTKYGPNFHPFPSYQRIISEYASVIPTQEKRFGSMASTNPLTCEITLNEELREGGSCLPTVVLEAIGLHEEAHSQQCLKLTDGVRDARNYLNWSNHPPNHALDEFHAYSVARDHMQQWVDAHCN